MRKSLITTCCLCTLLAGCPNDGPGSKQNATATAPGSTAPRQPASAAPAPPSTAQAGIPKAQVEQVLNPKGDKPYAGPVGTLKGTVTITGDPPPEQKLDSKAGCGAAAATYGKLFRVGQDGTVADVLVAVAGYTGYVPPSAKSLEVTIQECAYSTRTIALTFGQFLQIENRDSRKSYLPVLRGSRAPAKIVATPKQTVKLYSRKPGRYLLADEMGHTFMTAPVFVLKYATFDVTGLDGRYEITGIPVGEVQVNALLPAARMKTINQALQVKEGVNDLDLTIRFDASEDAPREGGAPDAGTD